MLSHGHMGAPLYRYTGQAGPDLGILCHLRTVKMVPLCHGWGWYPPQTASHILIRQIQRVWAIGMLSQGHMVAPKYRYTGQVGPRFGKSGSLVEWKWCHNLMVEADIYLRLLHISILDIYTVFKPLVWFLKGVCVHPYRLVWATLKTIASSAILDLWKFLSYPFTVKPPYYFGINRKLMKRPF